MGATATAVVPGQSPAEWVSTSFAITLAAAAATAAAEAAVAIAAAAAIM